MSSNEGLLRSAPWTRREVLNLSVATAATVLARPVICGKVESIRVFDSRIEGTGRGMSFPAADCIDVAMGEYALWQRLRSPLADRVFIGHTRWADFLVVRGQLEEHGLRVRSHVCQSGIVAWEMS